MKHAVKLNDEGIIEIQIKGNVSEKETIAIGSSVTEMSMQQADSGKITKILVDFTEEDNLTPIVVKMAAHLAPNFEAEKFAMCALQGELKDEIEKLVNSSPRKKTYGFFGTKEEATAWLKS